MHDDWYQFHFSTIICIEINRGVSFFWGAYFSLKINDLSPIYYDKVCKTHNGISQRGRTSIKQIVLYENAF